MRMSCNGCRVLRKGCSDNCSIRPCLQWIKSPESQANATVFLAKFYGRAGLMNLINAAGPDHLRPAIFRSLLYEACGRIVNPIYGSVGLLWSGSWQLCQAAVEAVLKGEPIMQVSAETAASPSPSPPLKACDIRHVSKEENVVTQELHKVKSRTHFKRSAKSKPKTEPVDGSDQPNNTDSAQVCNLRWRRCYPDDYNHHASESSSQTELNVEAETDSMFSNETVDASRADPGAVADDSRSEIELELTLGLEPISHATRAHAARVIKPEENSTGDYMDRCRIELGLHIAE